MRAKRWVAVRLIDGIGEPFYGGPRGSRFGMKWRARACAISRGPGWRVMSVDDMTAFNAASDERQEQANAKRRAIQESAERARRAWYERRQERQS